MRLRLQREGSELTVKILMAHEMESGQRKDDAGQRIPAWFIAQLAVWVGEDCVLQADWGPAVAKNPFVQFSVQGVQPGEVLRVAWRDNHGIERVDSERVP